MDGLDVLLNALKFPMRSLILTLCVLSGIGTGAAQSSSEAEKSKRDAENKMYLVATWNTVVNNNSRVAVTFWNVSDVDLCMVFHQPNPAWVAVTYETADKEEHKINTGYIPMVAPHILVAFEPTHPDPLRTMHIPDRAYYIEPDLEIPAGAKIISVQARLHFLLLSDFKKVDRWADIGNVVRLWEGMATFRPRKDGSQPLSIRKAEQPGADQPATKPADKVPTRTQPSPPTSKDRPR